MPPKSINLTGIKHVLKDGSVSAGRLFRRCRTIKVVVITFRGKPFAKLVPYQEQKKKTGKNELFGMWKDNEAIRNVDEHIRNLRKEVKA